MNDSNEVGRLNPDIPVCHHGEQLKQSTKGIEEWDKESHPFLILSAMSSSYGP